MYVFKKRIVLIANHLLEGILPINDYNVNDNDSCLHLSLFVVRCLPCDQGLVENLG